MNGDVRRSTGEGQQANQRQGLSPVVAHVPKGPGSSLGSAGAGWAGEIVCLSGLVCPEDVLGVFQVAVKLGQPEVIFWSIAFESDQEFWLLVWAKQSVGENIFFLKLFFSFHQLRWWCLMGGPRMVF